MEIKGQPTNPEDARRTQNTINNAIGDIRKYTDATEQVLKDKLEEVKKLTISNGSRIVKIMGKDVRMDSIQLSGMAKRSPQILFTFADETERDNFFKNWQGL